MKGGAFPELISIAGEIRLPGCTSIGDTVFSYNLEKPNVCVMGELSGTLTSFCLKSAQMPHAFCFCACGSSLVSWLLAFSY